jgi:hypothetical protein
LVSGRLDVGVSHASVAHNQILNGASVILSPFIGVELTSWKARTLPQVAAGFDPQQNFMILTFAKRHQRAADGSFAKAVRRPSATCVRRST